MVTSTEGWSQYQANPHNTGHTTDSAPSGELAEAWSIDASGAPAIADGTVYGVSANELVAAASGEVLWRTELDLEGFGFVPPTVTEDAIVGRVVGPEPGLYAVDRASGERRWSRSIHSSSSWHSYHDGNVFWCHESGAVRAFDVETGDRVWETTVGLDAGCTPVIHDGSLYVTGSNLYELDPDSGELRNESSAGGNTTGTSPTIVGDSLYYLNFNNKLVGIDLTGPTRTYKTDFGGDPGAGIAAAGDLLVFGSREGTIFGVDRNTSETKWTFDIPGEMDDVRHPAIADGTIFVPAVEDTNSFDGRLYALDLGGNERWHRSFDVAPTAPAVANGRLYLATADLVAYESA